MVGFMNAKYKHFEQEFSQYVRSKYAVSCNSGTASLHLALLAIGVGVGDEVIVPDFTMGACGFAVSYTGAKPVFVDCDDTLNIDVSLIEEKITQKTKAIMAVHIYGRLCDMKSIREIADKNNLFVIEDASEAHGAVFDSVADISCFSLYQNKIIHAEEGGVCTTNNKKFADVMNYYKNMAFNEEHNYFHEHVGYNYRMPESQAILALESLHNVDKELERRRIREEELDSATPIEKRMPKRDVVWVYDTLEDVQGENTRCFFKPLSSFPMYGGVCTSPKAEYYSKIGRYVRI
jgi:perosamine synthetase